MGLFKFFSAVFDPAEVAERRAEQERMVELRKITGSQEKAKEIFESLKSSSVSYDFAKNSLLKGYPADIVIDYIQYHSK